MKKLLVVLLCAPLFAWGSAHAGVYTATMNGASEVAPTASTATGFTSVEIIGDSMTVHVTWTDLVGGNPSAAHIHCCIAPGGNVGVAVALPGFPAATSGTYDHTFDLTSTAIYSSAFLTTFGGTAAGAEAALIAGLDAGQAYSNTHNAVFPGGEIRGLLVSVPEAATWLMMIAAFGVLGAMRRRARAV